MSLQLRDNWSRRMGNAKLLRARRWCSSSFRVFIGSGRAGPCLSTHSFQHAGKRKTYPSTSNAWTVPLVQHRGTADTQALIPSPIHDRSGSLLLVISCGYGLHLVFRQCSFCLSIHMPDKCTKFVISSVWLGSGPDCYVIHVLLVVLHRAEGTLCAGERKRPKRSNCQYSPKIASGHLLVLLQWSPSCWFFSLFFTIADGKKEPKFGNWNRRYEKGNTTTLELRTSVFTCDRKYFMEYGPKCSGTQIWLHMQLGIFGILVSVFQRKSTFSACAARTGRGACFTLSTKSGSRPGNPPWLVFLWFCSCAKFSKSVTLTRMLYIN